MDRRSLLIRAGSAAVAGLAGAGSRLLAQQEADRLRMPGAVQQRTVVTDAQNDETVKGIERRLKCTCGCNLDIFTCRTTDFTCQTSPAMHRELVALLEAGNTPDQVVAEFVRNYGEEVLMAPKPEGFNLAGYLVPGIVLVVAGGILAAVLRRRDKLATGAPAAATPSGARAVPGASADELSRLEAALQDVDR
jgi:cytochrome c-type biogenesis protein CcmH